MATTWNAIYLGKLTAVLDPTEGNDVPENAGNSTGPNAFVGRTFGSATTPLYNQIYSVQAVNNRAPDNVLNNNNNGAGTPDQIRVDLNGDGTPETYTYDAAAGYNVTVTFYDGSTATLAVPLFQTTTGETFIAPSLTAATNTTLASKAIVSIRLNSFNSTTPPSQLQVDRPVVDFACFAAGVMIATPAGEVAVETLAVGDMVLTVDHGPQPIRWIGQASIDLAAQPDLRPIRIRAGALGEGSPVRDLLVSPQHRVLVRSRIAQRMFGAPEVLIAARQLVGLDGIAPAEDLDTITYVHFLCDDHQVVWSDGAQTESLFTGAQALRSVGPAARAEILAIFPELATAPAGEPARPLIPGARGRALARRHGRNALALLG